MKHKIHFVASDTAVKFSDMPVISVPNPVFEIADKAQKNASDNGIPNKLMTKPPTQITIT